MAGTSAAIQSPDEGCGGIGSDGDQQASGGLRIEEDSFDFFGNSGFVFDQAFGEVAIGFEASGDVAGADAVESAFENGDAAGVEIAVTHWRRVQFRGRGQSGRSR